MCVAHGSPSVLISPSPLKALRERGIKGERVPRRGGEWGRRLASASDTNPLTCYKHMYYIPLDRPVTIPTAKGGPDTRGKPPAPEDTTSKPIPCLCISSARLKRRTPYPLPHTPVCPFPTTQAMEDALDEQILLRPLLFIWKRR